MNEELVRSYGISIVPAPNGWIVREPDCAWPGGMPNTLAVFNKLEDLQAALPALLGQEQKGTEETKP
jgi:hypothetical protein